MIFLAAFHKLCHVELNWHAVDVAGSFHFHDGGRTDMPKLFELSIVFCRLCGFFWRTGVLSIILSSSQVKLFTLIVDVKDSSVPKYFFPICFVLVFSQRCFSPHFVTQKNRSFFSFFCWHSWSPQFWFIKFYFWKDLIILHNIQSRVRGGIPLKNGRKNCVTNWSRGNLQATRHFHFVLRFQLKKCLPWLRRPVAYPKWDKKRVPWQSQFSRQILETRLATAPR